MAVVSSATHFLGSHAAVRLTEPWAAAIRLAARGLGFAVIVLFAVLLERHGVPRSIDKEPWEVSAQLVLLGIATLGYMIAWRFEGLGGSLVIVGGFGLGIVASIAYEPTRAFIPAAVVAIPGILFLIHWQNRRSRWFFALTVTVLATLLTAGGIASGRVYDRYFGPTHPESDTAAIPVDLVEWVWAGSVTPDGFVVKAEPRDHDDSFDLLVGTDEALVSPTRIPGVRDGETVAFKVSGLAPATTYYYAVARADHVDRGRTGRVTTFPQGAATFTFAMASCARTGSNGLVYDRIREADPLFFMIAGDFHYENISRDDFGAIVEAYERQLTQPAQQALFLQVPVAYTWDDHDFGGDGSDSTADSRTAVREAYRTYVPHYPLVLDGDAPIYQAFTVGRLRFIVTDTRSERDPADVSGVRSMLGDAQKSWLKAELLAAKDAGLVAVWVNSVPWIATSSAGADNWGGFADERAELAQFIYDNRITNLFMVSGDAHMLAADDGTNSQYAETDAPGFVVLHAAALDRHGKVKGGPYSEGTFPGSGQFGLVTVTDTGGPVIELSFSGRDYTGTELLHLDFVIDLGD